MSQDQRPLNIDLENNEPKNWGSLLTHCSSISYNFDIFWKQVNISIILVTHSSQFIERTNVLSLPRISPWILVTCWVITAMYSSSTWHIFCCFKKPTQSPCLQTFGFTYFICHIHIVTKIMCLFLFTLKMSVLTTKVYCIAGLLSF